MYVVETKKEMFEKVKTHLLSQMKVCEGAYGQCRYRWDGLKCAIGALIPDDLYDSKMEGLGASQVNETICHNSLWPSSLNYFADELQFIHDNHHPDEWKDSLDDLAIAEGLL